jgi:hypothetical protein
VKVALTLEDRRNEDGGFGPVLGAASEPEATSLMALAFDDEAGRRWLSTAQLSDGSIGLRAGAVFRDVTALAALALPAGDPRERALDRVVTTVGLNGPDPTILAAGWPWTDDAHGWVEPTAWGLLALRRERPTARDRIDDALAMLRERECVEGGWNYGSRTTLGVDLVPFVQTTALALLAIGDEEPPLVARGLASLERRWRSESAGILSLATAVCALDVARSDQASSARRALLRANPLGIEDNVVAAWTTMALERRGPW